MPTVTPDLVRAYLDSDALGLAGLVRDKAVTSEELTEVAIHLIERVDPRLNAVVIRAFDAARARARQPPGEGPFAGVPYLLKNIGSECEGLPMTAGLEYRKDYVSTSDSEMVRRIKASGLNILGRTNIPENGWSIATEPRYHGSTLNPWNPEVTPGGSSGGAAAAVASRMVPMAEGTDGSGSIRVPASCCGLVGLKPSRGRITYGPDAVDIWFGSVYCFTLTRTVRDTARGAGRATQTAEDRLHADVPLGTAIRARSRGGGGEHGDASRTARASGRRASLRERSRNAVVRVQQDERGADRAGFR
jgi:amidase